MPGKPRLPLADLRQIAAVSEETDRELLTTQVQVLSVHMAEQIRAINDLFAKERERARNVAEIAQRIYHFEAAIAGKLGMTREELEELMEVQLDLSALGLAQPPKQGGSG